MPWRELARELAPAEITEDEFWSAIHTWDTRANLVNRRLAGCEVTETLTGLSTSALEQALHERGLQIELGLPQHGVFELLTRRLLPRRPERNAVSLEFVIHDRQHCSAYYLQAPTTASAVTAASATTTTTTLSSELPPVSLSPCHATGIYQFALRPKADNLTATPLSTTETALQELVLFEFVPESSSEQGQDTKAPDSSEEGTTELFDSMSWIRDHVFPKILAWAQVEPSNKAFPPSLSLLDVSHYIANYNRLKSTYALKFIQTWTEKSDPAKFVHEDIAIAAYLITYWEEERRRTSQSALQSFADLGCGNGLLVYLLSCEGYPGYGIDLQRRRIWDKFEPQVRLLESALIPSESSKILDADWLIGNHSDELTPWIPFIASRSSRQCKFLVIPCCLFDFGHRFVTASPLGQYRSYLAYIKTVAETCGFHVEVDSMRIPSTKRICLIGASRNYAASDEATIDAKRLALIPQNKAFVARETIEARNCTQLDRALVQRVVDVVFRELLATDSEQADARWRVGGSVSIGHVCSLLDKETLKTLKRERGGLKTLLRNHWQTFIIDGELVRMRRWHEKEGLSLSPSRIRAKPCWFFTHHPDGCPLADDDCSFLHQSPSEQQEALHPAKRQKES
eukprot:m.278855 g.278855  ORF g.278855 m.278855 type:complete len:627 (+) comp54893_c2_seq7:2611-4491(+)